MKASNQKSVRKKSIIKQLMVKAKISKEHLKIIGLLSLSMYCFVLARPRYLVSSRFIIRQPNNITQSSQAIFGIMGTSSSVSNSVEDGRYLEGFLKSPEVMQREFNEYLISGLYKREWPDIIAGIGKNSNNNQKISFYGRQVGVVPNETSGIIELTTTAFTAETSLSLNKKLLKESLDFVNKLNNELGQKQYEYAETEITKARKELGEAIDKFTKFNAENKLLNAEAEVTNTSNYITALEANLIELKVEEGTLKRVYTDQNSPEIQAIRDQVQELRKQIDTERKHLISIQGRNLGGKAAESLKLKQNIDFAEEILESAKLSAESNRLISQQQVKLLVLLSDPKNPQTQDWNWRFRLFLTILLSILVINGLSKFLTGLQGKKG